jgi:hypothetical protein
MGAWSRTHEPPYGEGDLAIKYPELVFVTNLPAHFRWFTPTFSLYWAEIERRAEKWEAYRAADRARKRAARVERPSSYA